MDTVNKYDEALLFIWASGPRASPVAWVRGHLCGTGSQENEPADGPAARSVMDPEPFFPTSHSPRHAWFLAAWNASQSRGNRRRRSPLVSAQYAETKMGEYLHYALAAANGGVYAGIDGIGYTTVFGTPSLYKTNTGWVDLPVTQGFNTSLQIYGSTTGISHDGSVVAGCVTGTTTNGVSKQVAAYWVNGVESVVPAPPDDPGAITVSATAVSGDGTTLLVQDGTPYMPRLKLMSITSPAGRLLRWVSWAAPTIKLTRPRSTAMAPWWPATVRWITETSTGSFGTLPMAWRFWPSPPIIPIPFTWNPRA